jgi:hypothetical protein
LELPSTQPLGLQVLFDYSDVSASEAGYISTYHRSFSSNFRTAYLLTELSLKYNIYSITLRAWDDFLEALVASGYWVDALKLALEFHDVCLFFM